MNPFINTQKGSKPKTILKFHQLQAKIQSWQTLTCHKNSSQQSLNISYSSSVFLKTGLKSDSWRTLDDFRGGPISYSSGKLVNGKLHWVTTPVDDWGIMSIDLVDEKCRKVEQPCYGEGNSLVTLGVLGSDLSVICNYQRNNQIIQADVWIMKEYGVKESWTKLYTIKNPIYMLSPPLCMSNEGELLAVLKSTLMIYNSKDDLMRYPKVTNVDGSLAAELYIESLVCPV